MPGAEFCSCRHLQESLQVGLRVTVTALQLGPRIGLSASHHDVAVAQSRLLGQLPTPGGHEMSVHGG
jgi:hypothetical protein